MIHDDDVLLYGQLCMSDMGNSNLWFVLIAERCLVVCKFKSPFEVTFPVDFIVWFAFNRIVPEIILLKLMTFLLDASYISMN